MKNTLFFLLLAVEIALVWWGITNRKRGVRIVATIASVLLALFIGFSIAWGWAALVNYDQYVWRFSQYSRYIRGFAERQQIAELTNTVILFDTRFNARQDPHDLEDVIFQIFKVGKYNEDTNTAKTNQVLKK